jgi:hypothetical protein
VILQSLSGSQPVREFLLAADVMGRAGKGNHWLSSFALENARTSGFSALSTAK